MSKKSKKNLQKSLEKRRALQALSTADTDKKPAIVSPTKNQLAELPTATPEKPLLESHHSREITRTLISVLIIAILLIGALIASKQTHHFGNFGNWLYNSLKLNS